MARKPTQTLARQIGGLRRTLRAMDRALVGLARALERASTPRSAAPSKPSRRRLTLSPARRRALRLHGRYLGFIRQLRPRQRAEVRALRARKGVRAAIARARKLAAS